MKQSILISISSYNQLLNAWSNTPKKSNNQMSTSAINEDTIQVNFNFYSPQFIFDLGRNYQNEIEKLFK